MSETAEPYAEERTCAVAATAVDTACVILSGKPMDLMSLEIITEGLGTDVILPTTVLPEGIEPGDELIITFRRRQCLFCGTVKPTSWADLDTCSECFIPW